MRHVRPPIISAEVVHGRVGRNWTCPFCNSESTASAGNDDIGWIETPLRKREPRFICLGCCEDIYSTCATDSFTDHPYRDIVEQAAAREGYDVNVFRKICVEHQLQVIRERKQHESHPEYDERERHLTRLLQELASKAV